MVVHITSVQSIPSWPGIHYGSKAVPELVMVFPSWLAEC